ALDGGLRLLQLGAGGVGVPLLGVHVLPEEGGFVGAEDDAAGGAVEDDAEAGAAGGALRVVVGVEGCEACGLLGGGEGVPGGPVLVAEGGRRVLLGGAGLHVGACGPLLDQAGGLVHLLGLLLTHGEPVVKPAGGRVVGRRRRGVADYGDGRRHRVGDASDLRRQGVDSAGDMPRVRAGLAHRCSPRSASAMATSAEAIARLDRAVRMPTAVGPSTFRVWPFGWVTMPVMFSSTLLISQRAWSWGGRAVGWLMRGGPSGCTAGRVRRRRTPTSGGSTGCRGWGSGRSSG